MYNNGMGNSYGNVNGQLGGIGGYGNFQVQQPTPPRFPQPLSQEEIDSLRVKGDQFSLAISKEDVLRGICFHRDENKRETLRDNVDGTTTCLICGETFKAQTQLDKESVDNATKNILDLLQSVKLLYLDMPEEAAREYFQIIPMIKKLPKLYDMAMGNFMKHENFQNYNYNYGPNTLGVYQMLANGSNLMNNPYAQQQQMQQQMQMQQMMNPNAYAQQQMMMGGMPPMGSNGFGFAGGAAPNNYAPASTGYQYNPNTVPQPVVDPANNLPPAGQTVTVDQSFKA